jgi:hypothetical protein
MTPSTPTGQAPTGVSPDVIVHRVDETHVLVTPPEPGDDQFVVEMKMFLLACLHRRNIDPNFDDQMKEWLMSYSKEEFDQAVKSTTTPLKRH